MNKLESLMANYPELNYRIEPMMPENQKGLYINNVVYLNPNQSNEEMVGTLAEEIGHHLTSVGDIIEQNNNEKRQQEQRARDCGCKLLITPQDFIDCYHERLIYVWQCAEFLGVTTEYLQDAIKSYSKLYENGMIYKNYQIIFRCDGTIGVYEWFE